MASTLSPASGLPDPDPFGERNPLGHSLYKPLLGGHFLFESNSQALLDVVESTYGGLPRHELPIAANEFHVDLRLLPRGNASFHGEPPRAQVQASRGVICGVIDAGNYVVVMPEQHHALVVASEELLDHTYHLRYELIEFAVFVLATRGMGLVPLHGACVGQDGRGVLLLGASGSGKSTLALHSVLEGMHFLAEDAVFVQPTDMLATGVGNYLHVKADALRYLDQPALCDWIASSPVIRRRSGVEKFEANLRSGAASLAPKPLALAGAVFLSRDHADDPESLLMPLPEASLASRLAADQPYASGQPGWDAFCAGLARLGVHELRRGAHPRASVDAVRRLLA